MREIKVFVDLFILTLKCFLIISFFGIFLPEVIDYVLFYMSKNDGSIYNSIFVYRTEREINFVDIYIAVFRAYIRY